MKDHMIAGYSGQNCPNKGWKRKMTMLWDKLWNNSARQYSKQEGDARTVGVQAVVIADNSLEESYTGKDQGRTWICE